MKRKIIFAALAVAMLLSVFAISTSAEYDPPSGDGIKGFDLLDSASLNKIVQLALMQNTLGLGSASDECVIVYYWPSGSRYEIRYWAFTQLDHIAETGGVRFESDTLRPDLSITGICARQLEGNITGNTLDGLSLVIGERIGFLESAEKTNHF